MSTHVASLRNGPSVFENELGSISQLDTSSLPILSGLSIKRIVLGPGAIREPQWNVNANQIAYVTSGTVLVSMLGNADEFASFVVRAGADVSRRIRRDLSHRECRRGGGGDHRRPAYFSAAALFGCRVASAQCRTRCSATRTISPHRPSTSSVEPMRPR